MSFFDDLGNTLENSGRVVVDKAKELSGLANLRAQIMGCDNTMHKNYKDLGKAYYEAHQGDANFEYAEYMNAIKDADVKKKELQAKIAELKGVAKCDKCGEFVDAEDQFCPKCGAKVEHTLDAAQDATFTDVANDVAEAADDIVE